MMCDVHFRLMRLEIPLHINTTDRISQTCLDSLVDLPGILSEEEQECYSKTTQVKDIDLLSQVHNGAGK
jgi:hypothetical protein